MPMQGSTEHRADVSAGAVSCAGFYGSQMAARLNLDFPFASAQNRGENFEERSCEARFS